MKKSKVLADLEKTDEVRHTFVPLKLEGRRGAISNEEYHKQTVVIPKNIPQIMLHKWEEVVDERGMHREEYGHSCVCGLHISTFITPTEDGLILSTLLTGLCTMTPEEHEKADLIKGILE